MAKAHPIQKEFIDELIQEMMEKFPEVHLIEIAESPEDSHDLWLTVTAPENESRLKELLRFTNEKEIKILADYGFAILIKPTNERHFYRSANF